MRLFSSSLRKSLPQQINYNLETAEARVQRLRAEAKERLEAVAPGRDENLLAVCHLIFDILAVQDTISQERHLLSQFRS